MATGIFVETDTTGDTFSTACSGRTANTTTSSRSASETGTAGVTAVSQTIDLSAVTKAAVMFSLPVTAGDVWNAGTWTVRLNITTAITGPTWEECYVCRVNSGGTNQATIGSVTAQAISLATTGVKSVTISGSAQTPAAGDKVYVVLVFSNSQACTRTFAYTPNQNIDSPFTAPTVNINTVFPLTRRLVRRRKIIHQRPLPFIKASPAAAPSINITAVHIRARVPIRKRRRTPSSKLGFVKAPPVAAPSININTVFPRTIRSRRRKARLPRSRLGFVKAPPVAVPSVNINTIFIRTRRRIPPKKKRPRIIILSFGKPTPPPTVRSARLLAPPRLKRLKKGRKPVWLKPGFPAPGATPVFNSFGSDIFYDPANYTTKNAIYFEAYMSAETGKTARARLYNITGATAITGSDITTTSTTLVRVRSGDIKANMPASAVDMRAQRGGLAGDAPTIKSARLIIIEK
jgi:hypothetical protein